MSILNELNDKQREAASKIEGALLILAGAGSGKTRTITYRIAHMINEIGISPYKILAVTFTNKAAKEMKDRVEKLVGEEAKKATIATFHSLGVRLLRMYGREIGYNPNFTIYDTDDQRKIIKDIMKQLVINDKNLTDKKIVSIISKLKESGVTPLEYEKSNRYDENYKVILECYTRYNSVLKNSNGMDFSDILNNFWELLQSEEISNKLQERYQYIMVDEYQDTNNIQYKIITKLGEKYRNICVVGDENQSIYRFRGADIQNILDFEKDYKDALVVKLEENYRSTSAILTAANEVIKNNESARDKRLWTKKQQGELITVKRCFDGISEVNYVVDEILKRKNLGKKYSDFTILYRTNSQSRLFEEGLLRYNIPYKIFGGMQFYQRAEIKDILAYLSVINNPQDTISLSRIINVPKRKIGEKTVEKLIQYSSDNGISLFETLGMSDKIEGITAGVRISLNELYTILSEIMEIVSESKVSEIFDILISKIGYFSYLKSNYGDDGDSRIENVEELKSSIIELEKTVEFLTLREYLENVSLISATDDLEEDSNYVKLMTIHNSKGLEFPIVFLVGMEDDIFPGTNKIKIDPSEIEEERRLCYVAITRAEEKLYIVYAQNRNIYGETSTREPSRFINELPPEVIDIQDISFETGKKNIKMPTSKEKIVGFKNIIDLNSKKDIDSPYSIGEKVIHKKFGLGRIKDITTKKIVIQFVDGEREIALVLAPKFISKA